RPAPRDDHCPESSPPSLPSSPESAPSSLGAAPTVARSVEASTNVSGALLDASAGRGAGDDATAASTGAACVIAITRANAPPATRYLIMFFSLPLLLRDTPGPSVDCTQPCCDASTGPRSPAVHHRPPMATNSWAVS